MPADRIELVTPVDRAFDPVVRLVLGGIAWAVVLAATGEALGLSKEVGAFLADVPHTISAPVSAASSDPSWSSPRPPP